MISDSAHSARQLVFMNHRNEALKAAQIKHGEITSHNHQTRYTLRGNAELHRVHWFSVRVSRAAHWLPAQTGNTLRPGGGGEADSQGDGVNTGSKGASRIVQGLHATISEKIDKELYLIGVLDQYRTGTPHTWSTGNRLEEEIATLKQVLAAKEQHQAELKQKLGVTPLSDLRQNFSRSWHDMQASTAYKRTSETLSTAGQKTTEALSTLGTAISRKLEDVRNSTSFRSFEDKVESTVSNLKSKVGGNSSGGSFEEVLSSTAHASIQEVPTNAVTSESGERTC
ncbi:tumor protein D53 isoform X3 [Paramormyrops kingsleyae]|uniref:tumor protein D53 isoform X3 n=1 Tax=Paramormyrops kingsleyae TaxID=1676925 RepID=UPI003B976378